MLIWSFPPQVEDEQGFISFFHKLPHTESIRLFERGDYYTVHGQDAIFVAKTVYKTTSVIRVLGSSRNALESCTLSMTAFRNFLRQVLFEQGRRVEIWATQSGKRNSWELVKEASPGNLQDVEDDFAGAIEANPVIVTVKVVVKGDERTVGVCFADANVKELGVSEFVDNDLYSNLEVSSFSPQWLFHSLLINFSTSHYLSPSAHERLFFKRTQTTRMSSYEKSHN